MQHVISASDIRDAWQSIQNGVNPIPTQVPLADRCGPGGDFSGTHVMSFAGCSGKEMNDRLKFGYVPENAPDISADMGTAEMFSPRVELDEEVGQFLYGAMEAGEEMYFAKMIEQPVKSGLTLRVNTAFSCGTDAGKIISRYLDWVLAVMDAAATQGIPCDLDLVIGVRESWQGMGRDEIIIPVVRAGEVVDAAAWRPFLSPGSFRTLGFLAMGIAATRAGKVLQYSLGYPTGKGWSVTFDREAGILNIDCPPSPRGEFPVEMMTEKVQAAFDAC